MRGVEVRTQIMQKWILVYSSHPNSQYTTFFEASDRETAEKHVDIFFRILMGAALRPEILRSVWVNGERFGASGERFKGNDKVFEGSVISDENGGESVVFRGFLYNAAEFKNEAESQPNETDKTLLDRLKTNTVFPPI